MKKMILFLILFCTGVLYVSAQTGHIKGVVSTSDGKPAAMVSILVQNLKKNTFTDDTGLFYLRNLVPGIYDIEITLVGYEKIEKQVTIESNKTASIDVQMKITDNELQEVIVKSGFRRYKTNAVSPTLRVQTPILELPRIFKLLPAKCSPTNK